MSRNIMLAASLAAAIGLSQFAVVRAQDAGPGAQDGGGRDQALRGAAIALRQSLSSLSDEAPGEWRDKAAEQATEALHATNNAIAALAAGRKDAQEKVKEQAEQKAEPSAGSGAATAVPQGDGAYSLMVVPAGDTLDAQVAGGCWARVYSDTNFRGEALTFVGNVEVPSLNPTLVQGGGHESLIVGPGAALVASTPRQTITIHPNQRIPDMGNTQPDNMFGPVQSVRLACVG